jgi:hypothetical protein
LQAKLQPGIALCKPGETTHYGELRLVWPVLMGCSPHPYRLCCTSNTKYGKSRQKTSKMLKIKQNDHSISVEISKAAH